MGKIKMLLDTFLPFKQVIKWDRALYEGYFSCSSQKELIRWGKDSDYAGQRTLKLRKENGEILTKRKKNRKERITGYLLPKYMSEEKAGRVHSATKTMSLWLLVFHKPLNLLSHPGEEWHPYLLEKMVRWAQGRRRLHGGREGAGHRMVQLLQPWSRSNLKS